MLDSHDGVADADFDGRHQFGQITGEIAEHKDRGATPAPPRSCPWPQAYLARPERERAGVRSRRSPAPLASMRWRGGRLARPLLVAHCDSERGLEPGRASLAELVRCRSLPGFEGDARFRRGGGSGECPVGGLVLCAALRAEAGECGWYEGGSQRHAWLIRGRGLACVARGRWEVAREWFEAALPRRRRRRRSRG